MSGILQSLFNGFGVPFYSSAIAFTTSGGSLLNAYGWTSGSGFGAKYANPPAMAVNGSIRFSPSYNMVFVAFGSLEAVKFSASGFGTKFSRPTWPSGFNGAYDMVLDPSGSNIIIVGGGPVGTGPYIIAYPWSSTTGFGTKYANPASFRTNDNYWGVAINPTGNAIIASNNVSPVFDAYAWSSSGFGVKYASVSPPNFQVGYSCDFHPGGTDVAICGIGTVALINAYAWSSGFGTKYSNPASLPATSTGSTVKFHPSGNAIAFSFNSISPYVSAYAWSSGFGTKYTDPSPVPAGYGLTSYSKNIAFNSAGTDFAMATGSAQKINAYAWSSGFGTKYTDLSLVDSPQSVAFKN